MNAELEDWKNGWYGLRLSLRPGEIQHLIELLQHLQKDPEQHFHISSDYAGEAGIGDIEVSVATENQIDNIWLSGLATASADGALGSRG